MNEKRKQKARQVSSNLLSSFNYVLEKETLRKRLERILVHVERYRSGNPDGIVYYEDGYYRDPGVWNC